MLDYLRSLGDAVRKARKAQGLTQHDVADLINVDVRTILNIENYRGNPKMQVLVPLIRALGIDPIEVFYPEISKEDDENRALRLLLAGCSKQETMVLAEINETVLSVLRTKNTIEIKETEPAP